MYDPTLLALRGVGLKINEEGVCGSAPIGVTNVYDPTLLALRGMSVKFPGNKRYYVTPEWPPRGPFKCNIMQ